MMDEDTIYQYICDLVNANFITKEEALTFAETFHNNRRITDKQYEDLLILIKDMKPSAGDFSEHKDLKIMNIYLIVTILSKSH